ncbi:GNAT family N-acetyltransferase [Tenacibaculum sp. 190524A05c]
MSEEPKIKELETKDISDVVELVRNSFHENYIIPSIYRGKGIAEFISNELENKFTAYKYFVLKIKDKVAAFAEFKIFKNINMVFLNIIAVSNDYKNKKLGSKIFEYSRAYFQKNGFYSIELDVYSSNSIAINWYKNYGFQSFNLNSFYEIELNVVDISINESDIYIKNFPQYKEMKRVYGFYFLDINIENKNFKLGLIGNDLFIRGDYDKFVYPYLTNIKRNLGINKIYYIGSEYQFSELKLIDKIERMGLNIKL